jgi:hypothetical protein
MRSNKKQLVEQQNLLVEHDESSVITQQIIWYAVILVQGLCFIENGEMFSPDDHQFEGERHKKLRPHLLNFTGFEVDDFASKEGRAKFPVVRRNIQGE